MFQAMILGSWMSERDGKKMGGVVGKSNQEDLIFLKGLIEAGKVKPVIDRCYSFGETADALRYLGAGHARGKIVIAVER